MINTARFLLNDVSIATNLTEAESRTVVPGAGERGKRGLFSGYSISGTQDEEGYVQRVVGNSLLCAQKCVTKGALLLPVFNHTKQQVQQRG